MKLTEEEAIQVAMVEYLRAAFPDGGSVLWWHTPNQRPSKIRRLILSALGVRPGIGDLFFLFNIPGMHPASAFVEVKTPKGKLSPAQKRVKQHCESIGTLYETATTVDELERHLRGWMPSSYFHATVL